MCMKFKIGDRVIIKQGASTTIGKSKTITSIKPNPDSFDDDVVYVLDRSKRVYYYEHYLELDKEWNRNEKITKILTEIKYPI